jgi:hypothetical protein
VARMLRVGTANAQPRSAPQWIAFERRMAELEVARGQEFHLRDGIPAHSGKDENVGAARR